MGCGGMTGRLLAVLERRQLRHPLRIAPVSLELSARAGAEVSKTERRTELYVGTLRKFIEAMNGELVIAARFADGVEVPIRLAEEEDAA